MRNENREIGWSGSGRIESGGWGTDIISESTVRSLYLQSTQVEYCTVLHNT